MTLLHINGKEEFQKEVLDFKGIVLIDFYADRCGPCRMLGPIMEELTTEYQGQAVKIVKIDVDNAANNDISMGFQVSGIPAVFIIKDGATVDNVVGANPKSVYKGKIDVLLASGQ